MTSKRFASALLLFSLCLCVPQPVAATAIGSSTIGCSNLAINPAAGSLTLSGVWSLQGFASANNSLGQSDAQFNSASSPGTASATAAVTWGTASGSATALGDPPSLNVLCNASSSANIPGNGSAAAFATGLGTLSNSFTLSGTAPVNVQFAIDLTGALQVLTDALGLLAGTETIFSLQVDGNQLLFFDLPLLIGPGQTLSQSFDTRLSNSIMLDPGVSHFIYLEVDSESQAQTRPISEPGSTGLLLTGLALGLFARRRYALRS